MSNVVAIAIDTTGLPHMEGRPDAIASGWAPRIVAIGLASHDDAISAGLYIVQPRAHVEHPLSKEALRFNGIAPDSIFAGERLDVTAKHVAAALGPDGCLVGASAPFLRHFLAPLCPPIPDDAVIGLHDVLTMAGERVGRKRISLDAAMEVLGVESPTVEPDNRAHWRALCTLALWRGLARP